VSAARPELVKELRTLPGRYRDGACRRELLPMGEPFPPTAPLIIQHASHEAGQSFFFLPGFFAPLAAGFR